MQFRLDDTTFKKWFTFEMRKRKKYIYKKIAKPIVIKIGEGNSMRKMYWLQGIFLKVSDNLNYNIFFLIGVKDREQNKRPIVMGQNALNSGFNSLLVQSKKPKES